MRSLSSLVGILITVGDVTDIFAIPTSRLPAAPYCKIRIELDWIGLDRIGLDWSGLDWIGFVTHGFAKHVIEKKTQG